MEKHERVWYNHGRRRTTKRGPPSSGATPTRRRGTTIEDDDAMNTRPIGLALIFALTGALAATPAGAQVPYGYELIDRSQHSPQRRRGSYTTP